jgi:hypothetical protein
MARELSPATGDISESVVLGKISIRATVGVTFELEGINGVEFLGSPPTLRAPPTAGADAACHPNPER